MPALASLVPLAAFFALALVSAPAPAAPVVASPDCARLLDSDDPSLAARGHACLARAAEERGEFDEAIAHLGRAVGLVPADAASHIALMSLLAQAGRLDELPGALERGLREAPSAGPDEWLAVPATLFERGHAAESLACSKLLERQDRWRRDPAVLGSIGAALAVLERDEEALIYLRAAAVAAPEDPLHRWNLARMLAYAGLVDEASSEFSAWSARETDPERLRRHSCAYASFVERQLHDARRACRLQQEFCPESGRTACALERGDPSRASVSDASPPSQAPSVTTPSTEDFPR